MITLAAATCLALNIYWEARDQDEDGQRMVADVTLERLLTPGYPDTICGVVYEHRAFSWTEDGKSDKPTDVEAYLRAQIIADETLLYGCSLCSGATHYATRDALPYWATDCDVIGMWGNHIFYIERQPLRHPPKRPENF
ncbi:spore_SleB, spore cortex-lytic enzyme [uncultured Caudovirales phage]|uniref:Spore_SleB, spore cortex-lytic enzyme n=1 Tax=uncultured Caudovirales phage TaxID=2100421 RepID=A0A6J5L2F1_9CAUD|nr:spore_SleB, spore cortex-lytic enzyme [uncultured Caudovirales phage]